MTHRDMLPHQWDMLRETNPAKKPTFDAVVANPPFSYRWEPGEAIAEDMRFKNHGLAPQSAARVAHPPAMQGCSAELSKQGAARDGDS